MDVASEQESDDVRQMTYDVFVSFRGEDIRHGFLGHLTKALKQKQIYAFVDDDLEKGEEIWSSLIGAIKGSLISLTIFSENYASSRWCLEELVTILECREKYGQTVIPVFYHVEPTVVRHQKGNYSIAFVEHEKKYNSTTVQNWRHALRKAADLSGITSINYQTEVQFLGEVVNIVNLMLMRLGKHPANIKGLIGIDKATQHIESLLHQQPKSVRVIGIWGMGGIGKTTIAEEIFNKLYFEYDSYYFLANVRKESGRHETIFLKEKLFSTLLEENVKLNTENGLSNYIKRKIGRMKVLIILDDVNDSDLPEKLLGNIDWFGPGSRIIITTRDKQVLVANKVDDIYQVGAMNSTEALELFSLYAFKETHFEMEYYKLSKKVVNYAEGIPLVLKVLGRLLCGKDKKVWESHLDKLKSMPNTDVYKVMRLSYEDLDRKEQQIFLDLACSERDNSVVAVLERLKDKALITISQDNVVSMHDIIQETGWEIVRQESIEDPGSRSRLWDPDDIYEVFKNNKGTESIWSIRVHLSVLKKLNLSPHIFTKMSKVKFLYFPGYEDGFDLLPHGLQSFPDELRYLSWMHYPLKSLPENFSPQNLVMLDLQFSQVEKIWNGVQNLVNLKEIKVSSSRNLKGLPDLSKATNLEVLDIKFCPQMTSVPPSIFSLNKLQKLDLSDCSLNKILSVNHLSSLSHLNLRSCTKLKEFSVTSENMVNLDLSVTRVKALPPTFGRQSKLEILSLASSGIQSFPSSFKNLTRLRYLDIRNCKDLRTLTQLPPSLETLYATDCSSLKNVLFPSVTEQFKESRKDISFWNCLNLDDHSLKAIELNAHINAMKFAYQHPAPNENYDDHKYRGVGSYHVKYVYPGSSVPEWMEYKTTKDYMKIDISSIPHSSQLGFIFSFVIYGPKRKTTVFGFSFYITISDIEDDSKKDTIRIFMPDSVPWISKDHVCVVYDQECSHYLNSRAKNQTRFKIKVNVMALGRERPQGVEGLKGFGFSSINTSTYHSFMEHINTTACKTLREFSVTSVNMIMLDLSATHVKALPTSSGRQSTLEILFIMSSGIQIFPSCSKNLTRLQYLGIRNCQGLQTLTELLLSLENLYATDFTYLKTVLFPSIAEQFKESRKVVCFWNCLNLDNHSIKVIALNAHINAMKFAYHYLPAPNENYDDYKYCSDESYHVKLGFIFSFVVCCPNLKTRNALRLIFYITISAVEDESKKDTIDIFLPDSLFWI
ncbi:disease resistance protein RML1A-like [Abrus precatorius]|uniref:Disease resistance protein RML1A-like n=1 Tax=Abrus precatorius TaxID=3816 RepID=A0A8B8K0S6_ABRPR|nr:disease resistance protein RML1A-like [Abrus precatorius]